MGQALRAEGLTTGGTDVRNRTERAQPCFQPTHQGSLTKDTGLCTQMWMYTEAAPETCHMACSKQAAYPTAEQMYNTQPCRHLSWLGTGGCTSPNRHSCEHVHSYTYINTAITIHVDNQNCMCMYIYIYIHNCTHGLGHTVTQTCPTQQSCNHGYTATIIALYMETQ